jgi:hypothetical protein
MLFGDKKKFAIECQISESVDNWIFGNIVFWFCEKSVGNWKDSTDIKGCLSWINRFISEDCDRYEEIFDKLDKEHVFELLYSSVISNGGAEANKCHDILDVYSRFHISHLGMSSFEEFDILLIEKPDCYQRCIWRSAKDKLINECYIPNKEIHKVCKLFCIWLESEIKLVSPEKF